ncbi:serine protease [Gemmobacter aquaticus]|uniref:Serine protease n=2 Tax=Gemmobacter aquaticus TaxID=490185 RepID=A0A917YK38_9RHOB|nr:trypsin-like peptidase domain-containing protein [Gemmobacter aquaticus]GGO32020.1 serine protease [Gemmobacter aquaticus]
MAQICAGKSLARGIMKRIFSSLAIALVVPFGAPAQDVVTLAPARDARLESLETSDAGRGWEAVGKLELGRRGFCTGALIAPDLVLTAGHCLFDRDTGARIDPASIEFRAGWRNGRAIAYRGIKRAVAHPDYVYGGEKLNERVAFDIALLQLDQPIRQPSVTPFAIGEQPLAGDAVSVVSYAQDRSEAPSLQEVCKVLAQEPKMLMLTCDVDFGSSGAPVFAFLGGMPRIVSVVSAKAEYDGHKVAIGTGLAEPLEDLRREIMEAEEAAGLGSARILRGGITSGPKFLRPDEDRPGD